MDDTFLRYYEHELDDLRRTSLRFAAEFPKVARRLQLGEHECADPYVERLLEGVAFLTARIARKVDTAQSEFPETLLNTLAPEYNAPIASRAVLHIHPDEKTGAMPCGSAFTVRTALPDNPACRYTLREPYTPSGVTVLKTTYDDTDALRLAAQARLHAVGALTIELVRRNTTADGTTAIADDVSFFVDLPESAAGELLQLLVSACPGIILTNPEQQPATLPPGTLTELPPPSGTLALPPVAEYFLQPEQFSFFGIRNLRSLLPTTGKATLSILLNRPPSERLRLLLQSGHPLKTDCVRAVNIFSRQLDRITPSWRPSEHLVADATGNSNLEILQVLHAAAYDSDNAKLFDAYPIYHATDATMPDGSERLNCFTTHREAPIAPPRHRVSPYLGSELYLQLSGPDSIARREEIASLAARALCSNRDLPLFLRQDAPLTSTDGNATAHFATPPSQPHPPLAVDQARWMGLTLARLTPATLASYDQDALPGILRTLLHHLHREHDAAAIHQQINGIQAAAIGATTRTVPVLGDLCVVRGWAFDITLNEQAFGGSGVYHFARSLAAFLLGLTELNTFTEVTVRTTSGPIHTWQQQAKKI